jgi:hypothetical protein
MTETARGAARTIAVLGLIQGAAAPLYNFGLLGPIVVPPGFLVNAAPNATRIGLAVLVGLAAAALSVGVAIVAFPIFRRYSLRMALWLLALSVAGFSLAAVENTAFLSMLSLSQAYMKAGTAADEAVFQSLRGMVGSARNWAHYVNMIVHGSSTFVFYGLLYRFALVPRALGAFGMLAAMMQITAVTMPLFGRPVVFPLMAPLGFAGFALAAWHLTKGFTERESVGVKERT